MGTNKLALPLGGVPLGSLALRSALASELDHILVVTRADDSLAWVDRSLFATPVREKWSRVACAESGLGQAHSLRCGLRAAAWQAAAIVVLLADQPFVTRSVIDELIFHYQKSAHENRRLSYVAASHRGIARPPVLLSDRLFSTLARLRGDEGARHLLRNGMPGQGMCVEYDDPYLFQDIDTREDYERLKVLWVAFQGRDLL
ncbi:nucleotidyltransferase family protein [Effusibacillus pohliae]|uniref:nucleotidyltransferase family protein n=1 Tax=Effusibacillus pohliae TaxID=232270 RepID=UPI001FDF4C7B|nr:nucleotidyltransferase family protein [Effusibacillus pohliae]